MPYCRGLARGPVDVDSTLELITGYHTARMIFKNHPEQAFRVARKLIDGADPETRLSKGSSHSLALFETKMRSCRTIQNQLKSCLDLDSTHKLKSIVYHLPIGFLSRRAGKRNSPTVADAKPNSKDSLDTLPVH
ncbi:hypothetical protein D915_009005 [Fasciola hepatica]|uniref:Uncharacterized protein n=1 Tax=Fasciola hepatica TaxID=6192 RepID=A0A4E0R437_FASHE|nr:hypothetical protein D915_009005 [Fasciola hepatica]